MPSPRKRSTRPTTAPAAEIPPATARRSADEPALLAFRRKLRDRAAELEAIAKGIARDAAELEAAGARPLAIIAGEVYCPETWAAGSARDWLESLGEVVTGLRADSRRNFRLEVESAAEDARAFVLRRGMVGALAKSAAAFRASLRDLVTSPVPLSGELAGFPVDLARELDAPLAHLVAALGPGAPAATPAPE